MITIFLGAGFSYVGGVPLASQLFDEEPRVDRITRQQLVSRVVRGWKDWHSKVGGTPEEYLAHLQKGGSRSWDDAVWYVALAITLRTARIEFVGRQLTITRHNIDRTTQIGIHENFWSAIFQHAQDVGVITTNYDILAERGLRHEPRPRVPRPGFNYGFGAEYLKGGGYPSYSHLQRISARGSVPLLKLHGSVSWSFENGTLTKYHDCRPAIRGNPAIVAPITHKSLPGYLNPTWNLAADILANSETWIFVGYSLPTYDLLVRQLLTDNSQHRPIVHVFDPDIRVGKEYQVLLPRATIHTHGGLPEGLNDLPKIFDDKRQNKIPPHSVNF